MTGIAFIFNTHAQQLHVFEEWATSEGVQEFFYKNVTVTDDSRNVYVAGATLNENGDYDLLITKYDRRGELLWKDTIAGPGGGHDFATDLVMDGEGNIVVCGSISQGGAQGQNMLVVKYDPDGFEYWRYSHDYDSQSDAAASVCVNSSNRIFVTGATHPNAGYADFLTIHLNHDGTFQWEKTYDHNNLHDIGIKIIPAGNDLLVTGVGQQSAQSWRALAAKYEQADGTFGGVTSSGSGTVAFEEVHDMVIDGSGNIYLVGSTLSLTNGMDLMLIKLDDELDIQWTKTWDGSGQNDHGHGVRVAPNGDVYVCGTTQTTSQGTDVVLIKYNAAGYLVWSQTYNGEHNGDDEGASLEWHDDGYLYIAGSSFVVSNLDYLTLKYDTTGTLLWDITFNSPSNKDDRATNMALDDEGDIIVSGQCEINDSTTTYYTVKYVERTVIDPYLSLNLPKSKYLKPNHGQLKSTEDSLASNVLFINDRDYPRNYLLSGSIAYVFRAVDENLIEFMHSDGSDSTINYILTDTLVRVDMKFKDATPEQKLLSFNLRKYYENYFLSHFDDKRISTFENVVQFDLWREVDMILANEQHGLGIGFVCKPDFKPSNLAWEYEGADSVEITVNNSLIVHCPIGSVEYVTDNAIEVSPSGVHTTLGWEPEFQYNNGFVSLQLGEFDDTKTLVLKLKKNGESAGSSSSNGNLDWSTFYGGTESDYFRDVASDQNGNVFAAGQTQSDNFPVTQGVIQFEYALNTDICIVKFDHETLNNEWATYYGGSGGEYASGISINSNGEIIFCGYTNSLDIPVENEVQAFVGSSGFVGKLNPSGAVREWATPFGPSNFNTFTSVAVDTDNNVYCVGFKTGSFTSANITIYTQAGSTSYTGKAGNILKLSDNGEPLWSTTFGHRIVSRIMDIDIDINNNKYITGLTRFESENPEHTEPTIGFNPNFSSSAQFDAGDGFLAKFDETDNLEWSSWYCGNNLDQGEAIAVNNTGTKVCIVGATTSSTGFPLLNPLTNNNSYGGHDGQTPIGSSDHHGDGFIAEFASDGTHLFGSYFGDAQNEACLAVTYDNYDQIYITGYTSSTNSQWLTNTTGGISGLFAQNSNNGGGDGFIAALNPNRELVWGSFFGGSQDDLGLGIVATTTGKLYITGETLSIGDGINGFPLENPGGASIFFQDQLNITNEGEGAIKDGFIARFELFPLTSVVRVNEINDARKILVYPNPNRGEFIIEFPEFNSNYVNVEVYSIDGRKLLERNVFNTGQTVFSATELAAGIYLLNITDEGVLYSVKFIKH